MYIYRNRSGRGEKEKREGRSEMREVRKEMEERSKIMMVYIQMKYPKVNFNSPEKWDAGEKDQQVYSGFLVEDIHSYSRRYKA